MKVSEQFNVNACSLEELDQMLPTSTAYYDSMARVTISGVDKPVPLEDLANRVVNIRNNREKWSLNQLSALERVDKCLETLDQAAHKEYKSSLRWYNWLCTSSYKEYKRITVDVEYG